LTSTFNLLSFLLAASSHLSLASSSLGIKGGTGFGLPPLSTWTSVKYAVVQCLAGDSPGLFVTTLTSTFMLVLPV